MQAFFKGTVVLLYLSSYSFAEPIFLAACLLPAVYGLAVCLFLRFGVAGKMIVSRDRAKRMAKQGIISGDKRDLFYKKCIKKTSPDARASYALFLEDKLTGKELALGFTRSVNVRGEYLKGGMLGVGLISAFSVFLTCCLITPFGEALVRTALVGLIAALCGLTLHFILYAWLLAAEKAAVNLAEIADANVLREKRNVEHLPEAPAVKEKAEDEGTLVDLRALLRELDLGERGK